MQNTPHHTSARWFVLLLLGLAGAAFGQAPGVNQALPPRQVVTEGRSVTLYAQFATDRVQWQVAAKGNPPVWTTVADDSTYRGTATAHLEITNASAALDGCSYRFTNTTAGGVVTTSNVVKLTVSPLLFPQPDGIILDGAGGVLVSDASSHTIRRITDAFESAFGNDVICRSYVLAGRSGVAGSDDGLGAAASFNQPGGMAATADGVANFLAVADTANGTIRLIDGTAVTVLAGSSSIRGNADGAGVAASFATPIGIARAADGSYYVADSGNHTIRKVTADGVVSTFAGSPGNAGSADGLGAAARFNNPTGIAIDAGGTMYVTDTNNNLIRKITSAGLVTTIAGVTGIAGTQDGAGNQALFNGPTGLAWTGTVLFVADTGNSTIRWMPTDGSNVTTYAGVPTVAGLQDGINYVHPEMLLNHPRALVYAPQGLLFIADTGNAAIRAISPYDGVTLTLPLVDAQAPAASPITVTPVPLPAAPPAQPASPGQQTSGGGGACSEWFLAALAGLGLLRKFLPAGKPAGTAK